MELDNVHHVTLSGLKVKVSPTLIKFCESKLNIENLMSVVVKRLRDIKSKENMFNMNKLTLNCIFITLT